MATTKLHTRAMDLKRSDSDRAAATAHARLDKPADFQIVDPEVLFQYLHDKNGNLVNNDVAIISLVHPDDKTALAPIEGTLRLPFPESRLIITSVPIKLKGGENPEDAAKSRAFTDELAQTFNANCRDALRKKFVIFHCMQSANRTPRVAEWFHRATHGGYRPEHNGVGPYSQAQGRPQDQVTVVLNGGLQAYDAVRKQQKSAVCCKDPGCNIF